MKDRNQIKRDLVRQLRAKATFAEKRLIRLLLKYGVRFVFQKPFDIRYGKDWQNRVKWRWDHDFYIVDFWLPKHGTIIEVDGEIHSGREAKDIKRTLRLVHDSHKGIHNVLRFTNKDIIYNGDSVIHQILKLKCVRGKGTKLNRQQNKQHNKELARLNEIAALIKLDKDTPWWKRKQMVGELNSSD